MNIDFNETTFSIFFQYSRLFIHLNEHKYFAYERKRTCKINLLLQLAVRQRYNVLWNCAS